MNDLLQSSERISASVCMPGSILVRTMLTALDAHAPSSLIEYATEARVKAPSPNTYLNSITSPICGTYWKYTGTSGAAGSFRAINSAASEARKERRSMIRNIAGSTMVAR